MNRDINDSGLFATEHGEQAFTIETNGSYDSNRELWIGCDGSLAATPTYTLYLTYQNGQRTDTGADMDY